MKIHNKLVLNLAVNAVRESVTILAPYQAMRSLNRGDVGANAIIKRIRTHYHKECDLYVVGEQLPVDIATLKMIASYTNIITETGINSDQLKSLNDLTTLLNK